MPPITWGCVRIYCRSQQILYVITANTGGAKEETRRTISRREDIWMLKKILKMLIPTRSGTMLFGVLGSANKLLYDVPCPVFYQFRKKMKECYDFHGGESFTRWPKWRCSAE